MFPDNVTTFVRAEDPSTTTDIQNILTYQNYLAQGNFSAAQALLASMDKGIEMNINAGRFNEVIQVIEEIEKFYHGLNGVKQYINNNIKAFSNIALYNNQTDYVAGNIASDGNHWFICKQENGPSSIIVQPKVTDNWNNYWDCFIKNQKQYPIQKEQPTNQVAGDIWFELID